MRRHRLLPVVIIGKSILLREGLARILRTAHFRVLSSASSAGDLHPATLKHHPSLVLIVHTGETFDTVLEQIEGCKNRHANGRIAVVVDRYRLSDLISAFRAGASGYFVNVVTCDRFVKSLELVMLGETIFPPAFLSFLLNPGLHQAEAASDDHCIDQAADPCPAAADDPTAPLFSPRERLILNCLIEGDSNKFIARKLEIAEATVKVHVKAILRKIRVQNRTQAAIWGMNHQPRRQLENGNYPLAITSAGRALANHAKAASDATQLEPRPPALIDAARIRPLNGKDGRISGTARYGKQP
ncbi:Nitrate/nitrite response regulator protein NarL [Bradyrhizobium ivorense]|uniref:Nitrate/nitrite response regulator protein NarL n=1 Tax=Bradyrhizobium ivorense TaxID=2511166 RepID=A0A508SRJ6_9BRAD|nr:response regulator transcription factor [Bradyrhizobium ivorense]VIO65192.1 Nitrate/nitrite response regulator protein NarL [Bradyrhizobium ivorense]